MKSSSNFRNNLTCMPLLWLRALFDPLLDGLVGGVFGFGVGCFDDLLWGVVAF